ncbi:class I SAM-dependent methyltransferase [Thalassobacillus pellis]|uniref:class I SAM-dependent methyltransferase n=1 Tax=Thalassobacillus pellis TaxID=748008 RepID=UPI00195F6C0E|nr:class I SAM-dependent methyltransferase [Thalassobacillus pellis]MBM7554312.1 ubiquinone/menaquinone biosynthesis C-methylase UbiE [Thalassobacillus pellis]
MGNTFEWHKEAEKQWNSRADFWNENSKNMWDEGSRQTIIPFFQQYVSPGDKVADIGCGDGYGSFKLHQSGYDVTGVDIAPEMIERAKQQVSADELTFVQGEMTELDFSDESFDAVMAINSLEWLETPAKGLAELKRIVRPKGKLCIGVLGPTAAPRQNSYRRLFGENVICNTMMPWEFELMAEEMGLNLIGGEGVYKRGISEKRLKGLPKELRQAMTFMWIFMLEK